MRFIVLVLVFIYILSIHVTASEKDIYNFSWLDSDKEIHVLQNRKYVKDKRVYLALGGGITTSGAFVNATNLQGRFGYFFTENFGIEGLYSKNQGQENDSAKSVRVSGNGAIGTIPFRRIVDSYTGGMITWSPFYTKINTFNKIIYADFIFGVGAAQVSEHNNRLETSILKSETTEKHTAILWEVGANFFLSEMFSIRSDLTAVHYKAENLRLPGSSYNSNFDASVSLSLAL